MTTSLSKFRKTTLFVFLFKRCKLFKFKSHVRFLFRSRTTAVVASCLAESSVVAYLAESSPVVDALTAVAELSKVAAKSSRVLPCKLVPVAPIAVTKLDANV